MAYKPGYVRRQGKIVKRSQIHKSTKRARTRQNLLPAKLGLSTELRNWRLSFDLTQKEAGKFFRVGKHDAGPAVISMWEREGVPPRRAREVQDFLDILTRRHGMSFKDRRYRKIPAE